MLIVIISMIQGAIFVILQRKTDDRVTQIYNATGPSTTGNHVHSINNAVILQIPAQQATPLTQYRDLYAIYTGWPESRKQKLLHLTK